MAASIRMRFVRHRKKAEAQKKAMEEKGLEDVESEDLMRTHGIKFSRIWRSLRSSKSSIGASEQTSPFRTPTSASWWSRFVEMKRGSRTTGCLTSSSATRTRRKKGEVWYDTCSFVSCVIPTDLLSTLAKEVERAPKEAELGRRRRRRRNKRRGRERPSARLCSLTVCASQRRRKKQSSGARP
jgi:hypothetical protein